MLYKMVNLSNELSELSHDELQYVIDGYFPWAYKTMKQRGIREELISDLGKRGGKPIQHIVSIFPE